MLVKEGISRVADVMFGIRNLLLCQEHKNFSLKNLNLDTGKLSIKTSE